MYMSSSINETYFDDSTSKCSWRNQYTISVNSTRKPKSLSIFVELFSIDQIFCNEFILVRIEHIYPSSWSKTTRGLHLLSCNWSGSLLALKSSLRTYAFHHWHSEFEYQDTLKHYLRHIPENDIGSYSFLRLSSSSDESSGALTWLRFFINFCNERFNKLHTNNSGRNIT